MKRYPEKVEVFIANNYVGITTAELVSMVNTVFDASYTISQIRSYKKNHKLSSGVKPGARESYYSKVFPREVCEYIRANYPGVGFSEMKERLNSLFGTEYTTSQVKGYYCNHKLNSGITGYFPKGHVPYNKGKKDTYAAGCEKGWFKPGNIPQTHKPVGTECMRSDGYIWVKISEPNVWRQKHVLVWELEHGKRPPGHVIIFLDGDSTNIELGNLGLISMGEHVVMLHLGYRYIDAEHTKSGILLAKVKIAGSALKKRTRTRSKK